MKHKLVTCVLFLAISSLIGSIGFVVSGCKSNGNIQVVHNQTVVTNTVPVKAFNDEQYVWEGFIFSTNQVKEIKK